MTPKKLEIKNKIIAEVDAKLWEFLKNHSFGDFSFTITLKNDGIANMYFLTKETCDKKRIVGYSHEKNNSSTTNRDLG